MADDDKLEMHESDSESLTEAAIRKIKEQKTLAAASSAPESQKDRDTGDTEKEGEGGTMSEEA